MNKIFIICLTLLLFGCDDENINVSISFKNCTEDNIKICYQEIDGKIKSYTVHPNQDCTVFSEYGLFKNKQISDAEFEDIVKNITIYLVENTDMKLLPTSYYSQKSDFGEDIYWDMGTKYISYELWIQE